MRGNTAVLKCTIPSFVREYITVTSWVQDSSFNIYPSIKGDGKFHMLPSGELLVRRVDETDKYRSYQCRAVNRLTGATLLSVGRARFSVTDSGTTTAPRPLDKQTVLQIRKDQAVVLPCFAEGNPPPTFRWFRQDRHQLRAVPDDDRVFQVGECLAILHADEGDGGRWVCVANNTAGVERLDLSLHVVSPLSVVVQPAGQVTLDVGARGELHCLVSGAPSHPPAQRIWLKDGHVVGSRGGDPAGEYFVLEKVQREDAGMYQCLVRGEDDSAQSSVQLLLGAAHPQLLYKFINQTLQPGPPVSLKCIATGNPTPHITWHLDGFPLPQNERFVIGQYVTLHGDVISHVNISNVMVEDGGIYRCTAFNRVGEASHSADMRVYGLPYIRPIPNVTAVAGEPLYIACPVAGYPIESITWEKDGRQLPLTRRQHVFPNGTLLLENVQRDPDGGEYRCKATNKQGHVASQVLPLNVIVPPKIAPFAFQTDLHLGDRAGVQCFITKGDLPLSISWRKDGQNIESDVGVRQLGEHISSLSIESLRPHHAGTYTCFAANSAAEASHSSKLLVNVPPRIGPFTFGELIEGVRTQVQCVVQDGDIPLTITWLKDDESLPRELGIHVTEDAYYSTLAIPHVGRNHAGNYTCIASNQAKKTRVTAQLVVSVPPRWVTEPKDLNVTRDEVVMFHCQAEGFPNPTLTWRKVVGSQPSEYQDLTVRSRGLQIFSNGTLFIRQALPEHQGQYMCEATNGIGAGLSAVVKLVVHIPPEFEVKSAQASVRRGDSQTLQCQAQGDSPMSIEWQREGSRPPAQLNPRYEVKETPLAGGLLSELFISKTVKSDSGTFTCVAKNLYGRAERTVHLQVQDAPGRPQDLRVLDSGSRSVKVAWLAPIEDRSPVLQYIVQFQQDSPLSEGWQSSPAGTDFMAEVTGLQPATLYRLRVLAENELGAGEPSEPVLLRTEGEAPAGEPQDLAVTAIASDQLRVTWSAPPQHLWNGDILGYYVGYREHVLGRQTGYTFTTVTDKGSASGSIILSGLQKYRKYGVVLQAFNEKGPGPMSNEVVSQTLEDVPSAPPMEIKCSAHNPQGISVTWKPPPQIYQNGIIQGYKVYYENMNEWPPGHIEAETKAIPDMHTELHGLQKYANYSIQVWAFTHVGDGVKSSPIYCFTDEDVPEAPGNIKVLPSSPTSLVVSWMAPTRPNGRLISYTVYSRILEAGRERDSAKRRLPPTHTHYEVHDLHKGESYEFWVTAFTRVGEGQSTPVVHATISNKVPAAIISFGRAISVRRRGSLHLPCLAVGIPPPERTWQGVEGSPISGDKIIIHSNGSLHITDVQRQHQGNYTCAVFNPNGSDQIIYSITVLVAPSAPALRIASTSSTWLQLQWNAVDNGGSAVRGYLLNFRKEESGGGEWEERALPRDSTFYRLQDLECGTEYHLQLTAYNAVGSGAPSHTVIAHTDGEKPIKPSPEDFIESNTSTITLYLKKWGDNGCQIISFNIEYREKSQEEWITAGNNVLKRDMFTIVGLWPGTQYLLRVSAVNSAGTTTAKYNAATLLLIGGTLEPAIQGTDEDPPFYLDLAVVIPVLVSLITLAAVMTGVCICLRRKPTRDILGGSQTHAMVTLDNKQNLAQREQYYAAVQKGIGTHSVERIPEYAEDISPYATFHVQSQQPTSSPAHIQTFVYHDHRLAAMETMKLKSTNPRDDYTKLRANQKSKCLRSESSDYSGSTDHRSDSGQMSVPVSGSTRGDRLSLQTIMYQGTVGGGGACPESSTSPELSPQPDRRNVTRRHRHNVRSHRSRAQPASHGVPCPCRKEDGSFPFLTHLDPPTGFSDGHELSEAECDMDTMRRLKGTFKVSDSIDQHHSDLEHHPYHNFTIAV